MKESEIVTEQSQSITKKRFGRDLQDTKLNAASIKYMFVFYMVALLVISSMLFQYYSVNILVDNASIEFDLGDAVEITISTEKIIEINDSVPYDILIYALIVYCLGMFGIEGTRSVIASMELSNIGEKAKNMPKYKRDRLFQMLVTFILLSVIGMVFKITTIDIDKVNFHLDALFSGVAVFLALLAYSDFAPKLGSEISKYKKEKSEECKKE